MRKVHKRVLSLVLTFLMVFSLVPGVPVFAEPITGGVISGVDKAAVTGGGGMPAATASNATVSNAAARVSIDRINITPSRSSVFKGTYRALSVRVSPADADLTAIKWKSSDENVVQVTWDPNNLDRAVIYAVSPGAATVFASIDGIVAECEVTVKPVDIELSRKEITLQKDTKKTLTAAIWGEEEEAEITWKSSDETVAVVEPSEDRTYAATVLAAGEGKAVITAAYGDAEETCSITVTTEEVAPTPADQLDEVIQKLEAESDGGDEEAIHTAAVKAIASVKEICTVDNLDSDALRVLDSLENLIIDIMEWGITDIVQNQEVPFSVNSVIGAALNIPASLKDVGVIFTADTADMKDLDVPGNAGNAVAANFGMTVRDLSSEEVVSQLTKLETPVYITMDIPEGLQNAENLVIYNFHDGARTKIIPVLDRDEMTFVTDQMGSFVFAEVSSDLDEEMVMSSSTLTLYEGSSGSLSVSGLPEGADLTEIVWNSSNENIVAVTRDAQNPDKAVVVAKKSGEAIVSATFGDLKAECAVEVGAVSITLTKKNVILSPERTMILVAAVRGNIPDAEISWSSSNEEVAKIRKTSSDKSRATIDAIGTGTATIKAVYGNATNNIAASCIVTVTADASAALDTVTVDFADASASGDGDVIRKAADTAIDNAGVICTVDNMHDIAVAGKVAELESVMSDALGWKPTAIYNMSPSISISSVIGAALSLPVDRKEVGVTFTVAPTDITKLDVPVEAENAVAFDMSLAAKDYASGEEISSLTDLAVPVRITTEVPSALRGAEHLVAYNFHNGVRRELTPIMVGDEIVLVLDRFSPFVIAEVKQNTDNGNSGGSSSSGSNSASSINSAAGLTGQWIQDAGGWWFKKTDNSYPKDTWAMINGKWYHFDAAGYMQNGWLLSGGRRYYLQSQGDMAVSTWILDKGNWYYIHADGCMLSGRWVKYKNNWYYLNADGTMARNTVTPDGHTVDADGIRVE